MTAPARLFSKVLDGVPDNRIQGNVVVFYSDQGQDKDHSKLLSQECMSLSTFLDNVSLLAQRS